MRLALSKSSDGAAPGFDAGAALVRSPLKGCRNSIRLRADQDLHATWDFSCRMCASSGQCLAVPAAKAGDSSRRSRIASTRLEASSAVELKGLESSGEVREGHTYVGELNEEKGWE